MDGFLRRLKKDRGYRAALRCYFEGLGKSKHEFKQSDRIQIPTQDEWDLVREQLPEKFRLICEVYVGADIRIE